MRETLTGIAFPFRVLGGVQVNRDAAKIADDGRHLLSTRLGERVMLRSYGGGAHHPPQEAHDSPIRALIKHEIQEGLCAFLPDLVLVAPLPVVRAEDALTITLT